MAGASLFALLDDIASLLDDVAVLTKVAAKKTAGVLGDDLALNAQQVTGVSANRELPVVWAVAKGSLLNKAILVPAALLISALLPAAIPWLLMVGGAYLCYEGVEKLAHKFLHDGDDAARHEADMQAMNDDGVDLVAYEKQRIKGAVRTDFILSAEIIVLALGVVAGQAFLSQVISLVLIAVLMTAGVYGVVGGIVKLDDIGLWLMRGKGKAAAGLGRVLVAAMPWLMKFLSVAGTVAMFLVGGGIVVHNVGFLHHLLEPLEHLAFGKVLSLLASVGVGLAVGALVLAAVSAVSALRKPKP